jgi:hypothetical protein
MHDQSVLDTSVAIDHIEREFFRASQPRLQGVSVGFGGHSATTAIASVMGRDHRQHVAALI